jgi:branched-chain amino acid transport system substrate-binding protein
MPRRLIVSAVVAAGLVTSAGCGDGDAGLGEDAVLRVYASLPLQGPSGNDGRDAADGARLALADAGGEAGGVAVEATFLDGTSGTGAGARWSPAQAAENAREAVQDATTIAYLGDFEAGATRASLPVTNQARLLQVSPASAAVDLVAAELGSDDVPDVQATNGRTFGRVIPADDAQAEAAAVWAAKLQPGGVEVVSDHTRFGRTMADAFRLAFQNRSTVARKGARRLTYLAGRPPVPAGAAVGSDAYLSPPGQAIPDYVTSAALDPSQLPPPGRDFVAAFSEEYGRAPGRYAAYGYEAMAVILDSIDRASDPGDRPAVIDAFFDTTDRRSILGTYSIDEVGDTTLGRVTGYRPQGDRLVAEAELDTSP